MQMHNIRGRIAASLVLLCLTTMVVYLTAGCAPSVIPPADSPTHNTTDPTNNGAGYVGSAACGACHPRQADLHAIHGHSQKLKKISNGAPTYPSAADRAGIPNPPDGTQWEDVTYVIGGYYRKGRFINSDGFIMTDGIDGVNTQWNLQFLPNGTTPGFVSYKPDQTDPKPYDFDCFKCHTTGPSENGHQDSLAGIEGTFAEPGVQCEACHGPGSNHIPDPPSNIYVNPEASACGQCHSRGDDPNVIPASDGFVRHHQQYQELLASPHARFRCLTCHDTHTSTAYDRDNAIINNCKACHPSQGMALHSGKIFVRGDFVERLACESCHMPYATKSASAATEDVVGTEGRMGDIRTHIWYINTDEADFQTMFTADGTQVQKDPAGRAAVTVDFVCLRCHSGVGNAFALTIISASKIATEMHSLSIVRK